MQKERRALDVARERHVERAARTGGRRIFGSHRGASRVSELKDGEVTTYEISPEDVGLPRAPLEAVKGGDAAHNARMILNVLCGEHGACRDIVLLNAAAALLAANRAATLREGISFAAEAIDSKAAMTKLQSLIEFSNRH